MSNSGSAVFDIKEEQFSIARSAIELKLSKVAPAQCGVRITFSREINGLFSGGSVEKVSMPAPNNLPFLSAWESANSSTKPPRAQLMRIAPFFISEILLSSMMREVLLFFGKCRVTISDMVSNLLKLTRFNFNFCSREAGAGIGSQ